MSDMISRRRALQAALFGSLLPWFGLRQGALAASLLPLDSALAALEFARGGRLGVAVLDVDSGRHAGWRADERFALCSTFKLLLAGLVLREADRGALRLDEVIRYTRADLVDFSPVTEAQLERGGMTIEQLARAAQTTSDNTAANLLLGRLGGPVAFTVLLQEIGDQNTHLDRYEPELNVLRRGDTRDTTTPLAMARTTARLLAGDALSAEARASLRQWTIETQTGARRIRAGLPSGWEAGDKTGTFAGKGLPKRVNDVAIVWPPQRGPLVIAAFHESAEPGDAVTDDDESVLARVGALAAGWNPAAPAGDDSPG